MNPFAAVFWTALALVAYVYLGYPLLLAAWSRLAPRPVRRQAAGDTAPGELGPGGAGPGVLVPGADGSNRPVWEPRVSLVIAAHNERGTIAEKIENCLALDYPAGKLEVVLSLDAPSDGTEHVARESLLRHPALTVVESTRHLGKAAALDRAVEAATGEVLVFCDARQAVAPDAVRHLVACLADPGVGAVTGELVLLDGSDRQAADGVGLYWRYEKALRAMESRIHSTVGATGALYAVRRELYSPLPRRAILDDVIVPMRAVLAGRRTVFEPRARAYDRVCPPEVEFRRKVRTLAGNFQLIALMPELLQPWRNPVFLQFVSHKLGRLLVPHLLVVLLVANAFLLDDGVVYRVLFAGQCGWYLLAVAGAIFNQGGRRGAAVRSPLLRGERP